jgi:hypothetical protein
MRQLAEDLWVVERPLRFAGLALGARMTVVRLRDGGLFLHSPVALDDDLRAALLRLGPPRHAVAPNRMHHLFIGDYRGAFADIRLYAAPGLAEKRSDLAFDEVLSDAAPAAWADQLDQAVFAGQPSVNEVVFCHRASRSLLACDLAFNIGREAPPWTRLALRLIGGHGHFGPTLLERLLVRDRAAARSSLARILAWDFERVVVAHGAVLESGGHAALRDAYRWLTRA